MVAFSGPMTRVVARVAGGLLGDDAEADRVMVAAGDQRRPRRRAERGRVELRVAQARLRDAVQCGRRNDAAERAGNAVPVIVGHDQQDVRRTLGRHHLRRPVRLRLVGLRLIMPPKSAAEAADTCRRSSSWRWANPARPSPAGQGRRHP